MENYTFLICACSSIKYVSVTNVLKGGLGVGGLRVKIEGGRGIKLETECFIYSITGRLTTILYAIIGCLIEKSLTLSLVGE